MIMQELRDVEHLDAPRCDRFQSLCARAGIGKNWPSTVFAGFDELTDRLLGLAVALAGQPFGIERLAATKAGLPRRHDDLETGLVEQTIQRGGDRFAGTIVARGTEHLTGAAGEIDNAGPFHVPFSLLRSDLRACPRHAVMGDQRPTASRCGSHDGSDGIQATFAGDQIESRGGV